MSASDWAALGLEPTDDVAAIRKAYARRLKGIDVEADPAAFITLRGSLETALAYAACPEIGEEETDGDAGAITVSFEAPVFDSTGSIAVDSWEVDDWTAPDLSPADDAGDGAGRFARLESLLFDDDEEEALDRDALATALREILDHPNMDKIEHEADVQQWLADLLAHSIPRSDPIIPTVVTRFGWEAGAGQWDRPWALETLVDRHRSLALIDRLADPTNELHKAWLDLTSRAPALGFNRFWVRRDVRRLLKLIREQYQAAEPWLERHRVALWDERLNSTAPSGIVRFVIIGLWVLWMVARASGCYLSVPQSGTESRYGDGAVPITSPESRSGKEPDPDLAATVALISEGRFTLASLKEQNPELHNALTKKWIAAIKAGDPPQGLKLHTLIILENAAGSGLREGSYELQRDYWRVIADRAIWARGKGPQVCDNYLRSGPPAKGGTPREFTTRMAHIVTRAIFESREYEPPPRGRDLTLPISESIGEAIVKRSGLRRETVSAALQGRGTPAQRCNVQIALIEIVLDLPREEGAPLLKTMSRRL